MTKEKLLHIINNKSECEYVEYKDGFRDDNEIGEYISALSNGAALRKQDFGYLIWGVQDRTMKLTNSKFNYEKEVNGDENYAHYLSRNLNPHIDVEFKEEYFDSNRVVYVEIPAASDVITDYKNVRYIRVGSSKEDIRRFPKIEKKLWKILNGNEFSLKTEESPRQDLTFRVFKIYLDEYHLSYTEDNMFSNNFMLTYDKKFNYIAYMLSDQFDMSFKVVKFGGINKQSEYVYRKEFGGGCVLKSIDSLLDYMEFAENKVRSYFNGKASRRDEFLFNKRAFREAYINAVLHNNWEGKTGPAVFLFKDRLEIYSYGSPLDIQTKEEFLSSKSKPINTELAKVFMKFDKFEESGRGVSTILEEYNKSVFDFTYPNSFTVVFKYNKLAMGDVKTQDGTHDGTRNDNLNLEELIVRQIALNNKITRKSLANALGISVRTIQRIVNESTRIRYVGSGNHGHWEIVK